MKDHSFCSSHQYGLIHISVQLSWMWRDGRGSKNGGNIGVVNSSQTKQLIDVKFCMQVLYVLKLLHVYFQVCTCYIFGHIAKNAIFTSKTSNNNSSITRKIKVILDKVVELTTLFLHELHM